ncbi:MAG: MFS transporter [Candidatus Aenigmarchaeota archaeon]|nr:MFS transporter [Candidatus Aenigmarchaeota archaeon]
MNFNEYMRSTEINTIFILAISMMNPVLAPYMKSIGFSNIQLSMIFAINPLILIFYSSFIGKFSDYTGRRKAIILGIMGESLAIMIYLFNTNMLMFAVARMLDAMAGTTVTIVSMAAIEDSIKKKRGKYTGISLSLEYVGKLLGPVVGGLLADVLFIKAPFATSLVVIALLLFLLPRIGKKKNFKKSRYSWLVSVRRFLSFKELRGLAILGFAMHSAIPAFLVFLPLLITEGFGLSYVFVGYAILLMESPHILQFIFGKWADKNANNLILLGAAASGILLSVMSQINVYTIMLLIIFIRGIGLSIWNTSAWTLMSKIGERERMEGEVVGSYFSIVKIGTFLSYIVSGFMVSLYSIEALFFANGIVILIGVLLSYPFLKK